MSGKDFKPMDFERADKAKTRAELYDEAHALLVEFSMRARRSEHDSCFMVDSELAERMAAVAAKMGDAK